MAFTLIPNVRTGFVLCWLLIATPWATAQTPVVENYGGQWHDRKHKRKGTVSAVLTKGRNNQWSGVFTGVALGRNYRYTVRFTERVQGSKRVILGNSTIDGSAYRWAASIIGTKLSGTYQAANGNFGTFTATKR